ncbi:MAG: helix-turn-helix transcriptional regulator [Pedobacter sp.]|nr:helix-turn-helix transcriptional regulator [Pedobacter sp.]
MNLIDRNQKLPPGLVDKALEFFIHEHEIKCLYKGTVYAFCDFPAEVIEWVEADMVQNPKALKALADWDITDPNEQMRQYISCRFGGFDNRADIEENGKMIPAEYVDCGRRGSCAYEGKLCTSIQLANGILTKREIEVLRLLGECKFDKEICDLLGITQDTLRNHKDNISQKAGIERKPALSILAHKLNLL